MRSTHRWAEGPHLDPACPLPLDRPFTLTEAARCGVPPHLVTRLVESGHLRRMLHGVAVADQVPDSLRLRVAALTLVLPEHVVVVDTTAAWLHGVDALPRSAIHEMPMLDVFSTAHSRMRRAGLRSGLRTLEADDIEVVGGLRVTTHVRTALDLGRSLWRYDALGALDGFLRAGVDRSALMAQLDRFKGQRGIRQLRELLPLASPLAESNPESALRLHWIEADLPEPQPQVWEYDDDGTPRYRVDVGDPEVRYAAEYFGEAFHGDDCAEADDVRLHWLDEQRGWEIDVFRKDDIYGRTAEPQATLRAGWARGHHRAAKRAVTHIDLSR